MVYKIVLLLLILFIVNVSADEGGTLTDTSELVWQKRVILVWKNNGKQVLLDTLTSAKVAIDDREIIWFVIAEDSVQTNYRGRIGQDFVSKTDSVYANRSGNVLLLGKDGGVKNVATHLDLANLFRLIDSMPMRKFEMKTRRRE